jgi:flagellar biosynthesis protein FlhF
MDELGTLLTVSSELGKPGPGAKIAALVGPPGVGKTTTLVKLAVTYGLMKRKATQLLSVGARGYAGVDQLRTYAAVLGVGYQALETVLDFPGSLEDTAGKDLILIDTPGFGAKDLESAANLAAFFRAHPEIDIHLVISCNMKPADVARVVDQFEIFCPAKLLFTKLDETEFYGSILNEAVRKRRPISFLTGGRQIPEDLEAPSKERIIDLVLRGY